MNDQPRNLTDNLTTAAETALAEMFARLRADLPGDAFAERRDRAFAGFAAAGLPHRRVEAWKYTDLRRLMREAAPPAGDADGAVLDALVAADPLAGVERIRIVLVNGRYRADLSDAVPDGVTVEDAAALAAAGDERLGARIVGEDALVALNTAFLQGGVAVTVAKDARPGLPLEIVHLTAAAGPVATAPRLLVALGENAEATVIETFRGPDGAAYQVNAVAELDLAQGARIEWTRLLAEGDAAQNVASFFARLGRDAALNHLAVNAGAALWRWQAQVLVAGEGADATFSGATMLAGEDHGDIKLTLTHASGHSTSRENFKSVADDRSEGAFQGLIEVNRDAQKTDARMMAQALLLSDEAQFASKPELEIFADDVQCGHGSTSGRIDRTQLFYLLARGIPRAEAERLLIEGFLDDAIDAIADGALAQALRRTVSRWLARRRPQV